MIFKYDVVVPLTYNRYDVCNQKHDSEIQYRLEKESVADFDIVFKTYELPGYKECGYDFNDVVHVKLYESTTSEKSMNGFDQLQLFCEIKGILVDDEVFARKYAEEILEKICKRLSILFIKCNANRHSFQPRVEALWSKAVFNHCEYSPYVKTRRTMLEQIENKKNADGVTRNIILKDQMHMRDSCSIQLNTSLHNTDINLYDWLMPGNDGISEFLLNEYYLALGTENVKSKFFHLFAMIEFCEKEYENHNGSVRLFKDDEVNIIKTSVEKQIEFDKNKMSSILSLLISVLKRATDIGRADKLLNILDWMGIESYNRFGIKVMIDRKLLDAIIKLRNKSFHGTGENPKEAAREYSGAVEKLFYINEQIINFVMKKEQEEKKTVKKYCIRITGKH